MKILLTGANGYIGMRLLPALLKEGHDVVCAVRSEDRFSIDKETRAEIDVVEIDFLEDVQHGKIPKDIDVAFYLIHSMSGSTTDFDDLERKTAENFNRYLKETNIKQVVFLSGIINE